VENLLRKYLWALDGLVVALVAIVAARSITVQLATSLSGQASWLPAAHRTAAPPPEPSSYKKEVDVIVSRNIFCSTCRPVDASPDGEPAGPLGPLKTALPLKLMAIMYAPAPAGAKWSTAVIRDTELAIAGPFRVGDAVHGATISEIGATRVMLDNAGRTEFLDLMDGSSAPPAAAPQPPAPAPAIASRVQPTPPVVTLGVTPPRSALAAQLFQVRGDRIKRHPH